MREYFLIIGLIATYVLFAQALTIDSTRMEHPNPMVKSQKKWKLVNNTPYVIILNTHDPLTMLAHSEQQTIFPDLTLDRPLHHIISSATIHSDTHSHPAVSSCSLDGTWGNDLAPILYDPTFYYTITANLDPSSHGCSLSITQKKLVIRMIDLESPEEKNTLRD